MKILIFGVSNVGKTTTGKILADKLGYKFYDLDDEVKSCLKMTLEEFVNTGDLCWRDSQRGNVTKEIIKKDEDLVLAVSPISYIESFKDEIKSKDIILFELYDSANNIFSRLIFSDENDNLYIDDDYKYEHMEYYINDIKGDLEWYGDVNRKLGVKNRVFVNGKNQEKVADEIIKKLSAI